MKRDLDLIRTILFKVEAEGDPTEPLIHSLSIDGMEQPVVNEHVKLLIDGGLLEGECKFSTNNRILLTAIRGLTPRAYDFLDNVRSETLWTSIKDRVSTTTGTASFDIIEDFARQIVAAVLARPKQA
jgi:hypothetical protein